MAVIKSQFTLRLKIEVQAKIQHIANEENRSTTNMIECVLQDKIKEYEDKHGTINLSHDELYVK